MASFRSLCRPFFCTFLFYLATKGLNLLSSVYITLIKWYFLLFRCIWQKGKKLAAFDRKEGFGASFEEEQRSNEALRTKKSRIDEHRKIHSRHTEVHDCTASPIAMHCLSCNVHGHAPFFTRSTQLFEHKCTTVRSSSLRHTIARALKRTQPCTLSDMRY